MAIKIQGSNIIDDNRNLVTGNTASFTGAVTASQLVSTAATGTAPFTVTSNTVVTNLNADHLDGFNGSYYLDYTNATNKPTIGNGAVTLTTSGIATGSASITMNQTGNSTFTVNVPGTDLSSTSNTTTVSVTSSTGTDATIAAANATVAGVITTGTQTIAGTKIFSSTISGSINGNAATATYANDAGGLRTSSGGAFIIDGIAQSTPVNYLQVRAANTGQDVLITTAGTDPNVDLLIQTKGAGSITIDTGTGAGPIDIKPGSGDLRIWNDTSTNYVKLLLSTGELTSNTTLTLPNGNVTLVAGTMVPTSGTGASGNWDITASAATTLTGLTATVAKLNFSSTVTSNIQDQLDAKAPLASPTLTGTVTAPALRLTSTSDANTSSTGHGLQVGDSSGINLLLDNNEIMVRNAGANGTLFLNSKGGSVTIGGGTSTTSAIALRAASTTASGDFTATGNVTAYSDARLKSNVATIDSALEKVHAMRGVYFEKDGIRGTGVIAQEIERVLPEVVMDGEYKSVAYGNIVGVLIEAIKELKAEIEELKRGK